MRCIPHRRTDRYRNDASARRRVARLAARRASVGEWHETNTLPQTRGQLYPSKAPPNARGNPRSGSACATSGVQAGIATTMHPSRGVAAAEVRDGARGCAWSPRARGSWYTPRRSPQRNANSLDRNIDSLRNTILRRSTTNVTDSRRRSRFPCQAKSIAHRTLNGRSACGRCCRRRSRGGPLPEPLHADMHKSHVDRARAARFTSVTLRINQIG